MQALLETRENIRSTSSKFDDRTNLALSGGVVKQTDDIDSSDYIDYANYFKINSDKLYFQKRIAHETALLKKSPNNLKLLVRIGDIYFSNYKIEKAKIYFTKAFRQYPDNLIVLRRLVEIFLIKGKPEQADGLLSLSTGKFDSNTLHLQAVIKLIRNQYAEAEQILKKVPSKFENYYEVLNSLGIVHLSQNSLENAKKNFQDVIALNDSYAPAKANLALCLQKQGDTEKAVEQYKTTIHDHPDFVTAYNNLYNLFVSKEMFQEAYELMDSARELATPDNEIQFRIGWSLMALGRLDDAINEYKKVLEIIPGNSSTLNNIGHCYDRMGRAEVAISYFEQACKTRANNVFSYLPYRNLMVVSNKLGDFKKAKSIANNILVHYPNDVFALVYRGVELVDNEQFEEALKALLKAYASKPPLISLYISLSFLYSDIYPDYEKGMEVCEYALHSNIENSSEVINNLVHLNLINNHADVAERYIQYLDTNSSVNLCTLALYDLYKNKYNAAMEKYDKAMTRVKPEYMDIIKQRKYYDLGNYYLRLKKNKRAVENYSRALEDAPKGLEFIKNEIATLLKKI